MSTEQFGDDQQYAALEHEMAQPDPTLPDVQDEPYTPPSHEPPAQSEPQQQQQYGPPIPDQNEDPIGHFDARQRAVEGHLQHKECWDQARATEDWARQEIGEDYDAACDFAKEARMRQLTEQFPDTHQNQVVAYRHGYQSPAHLRQAILERDIMTVAQHAIRNGAPPAFGWYNMAREMGFKPKVTVGKTQHRAVVDALENAPDADADKAWAWYSDMMRQADERQ